MTETDTFFKVVRPDLGSFHDPNFKYRIGAARRAPSKGTELCGPGLLHASPTAPQAARYGEWPYRLLQVEGEPVVSQHDKAGFHRLMVVAELPVQECWGPCGGAVLSVVRQAETLTDDQARLLRAAGYAAWYAAGAAARYAARDAARDAARAAAWSAAGYAAGYAAWYAAGYDARGAGLCASVHDLVGQYGYTQQHEDTLMGPWESVFGRSEWRNA